MATSIDMFTETTGKRIADSLDNSTETFISTMAAVFASGGASVAVTSAIIADTVTGTHYALTAENGAISLLEVAPSTTAKDVVVLDVDSGTAYKIICTDKVLSLEEA